MEYFYNYYDSSIAEMSNDKKSMSFSDLIPVFNGFELAFQIKDVDAIAPVINVWTDVPVNGVNRISATYNVAKGLFSSKIKVDEFFVEVQVVDADGEHLYLNGIKDFSEFKKLFYEFVVNQQIPDLKDEKWTEF